MRPQLPRVLLWADKQTLDDLFELDPLNVDLYEILMQLNEEPYNVKADALKVLNEVYYLITRIYYERPLTYECNSYTNEIKANLGWNYSAELVFTLSYFLITWKGRQDKRLSSLITDYIRRMCLNTIYWKPVQNRIVRLKRLGKFIRYKFTPVPLPPTDLQSLYLNWEEITREFNTDAVERVLALWNDKQEKSIVAKMIEAGLKNKERKEEEKRRREESWLKWRKSRAGRNDQENVKTLLQKVQYEAEGREYTEVMKCAEPVVSYEEQQLQERIVQIEKEKMALQDRINELESENGRLNTLLANKKRMVGKDRRFTLVQIVDYCKGCVEWTDVKSIVAMLNKLLRRIGTVEDSDLVDSIETEFLNRKYGNTFNNANVTMQNPQIQDVYRITGNDTVNLGDQQDGDEEDEEYRVAEEG